MLWYPLLLYIYIYYIQLLHMHRKIKYILYIYLFYTIKIQMVYSADMDLMWSNCVWTQIDHVQQLPMKMHTELKSHLLSNFWYLTLVYNQRCLNSYVTLQKSPGVSSPFDGWINTMSDTQCCAFWTLSVFKHKMCFRNTFSSAKTLCQKRCYRPLS